jgi:hypothetical protein
MTTEASARSLLPGLLLFCLFIAISACSKGTPRVASDLEAEIPAQLHGDYESFIVNCSKCHGLERPLNAHVTDTRHWDLYVARMMRTAGSAISESERPRILRFLYWYTERKLRLNSESSAAAKESVAAPQSTGGAQEPAAPAAAPSAPAAPTPQDVEPKNDSTVPSAQGKPGESAP